MPCWTITYVTTELPKMNAGLLKLALERMGAKGIVVNAVGNASFVHEGQRYDIINGVMKARNIGQEQLDATRLSVVKGYNQQVVLRQARANGWQVRVVSKDKWQVIKG